MGNFKQFEFKHQLFLLRQPADRYFHAGCYSIASTKDAMQYGSLFSTLALSFDHGDIISTQ
jgi:hypothetical protein